jgi:hypothetical protein
LLAVEVVDHVGEFAFDGGLVNRSKDEPVGIVAAPKLVPAQASVDLVVAVAAVDLVVAVAAVQAGEMEQSSIQGGYHALVVSVPAIELVPAVEAVEPVDSASSLQNVVSGRRLLFVEDDGIIGRGACTGEVDTRRDCVAAAEDIVAFTAVKRVGSGRTLEKVVVVTAILVDVGGVQVEVEGIVPVIVRHGSPPCDLLRSRLLSRKAFHARSRLHNKVSRSRFNPV